MQKGKENFQIKYLRALNRINILVTFTINSVETIRKLNAQEIT